MKPVCHARAVYHDADLDDGSQGHTRELLSAAVCNVAVIDTALGAIESRFASDTWTFLSDVESALITVPVDTNAISDFYGSELSMLSAFSYTLARFMTRC